MILRPLTIISIWFFLLHGMLFAHDLAHRDAFLTGDRGDQRMEKIAVVLPTLRTETSERRAAPWKGHVAETCLPESVPEDAFLGSLSAYGQPGDYLVQGLIWLFGGQYTVILFQVLLAYVGVIYVYRIAERFLSESFALACACMYVVLPASLMQPHQLVTEAIYNPALLASTHYFIRHIESQALRPLFAAAAALAVGIFTRTQLALLPILLMFFILAFDRRDLLKRGLILFSTSYSLLAGWLVVYWLLTGEFGLDKSESSLGLNLYIQAMRAEGLGWAEIERYTCKSMSVTEFVGYVSQNPRPVLIMRLKDFINLVANPTTYKFFGEYLGVIDRLPWDYTTVRDQEGFWGVMRRTVAIGPTYLLTVVVGGLGWSLVMFAAGAGAVKLALDETVASWLKWIVLTVLLYGLLVPMVATPRSTHRSPIEFIIVLLFCYILQWAFERRAMGNVAAGANP